MRLSSDPGVMYNTTSSRDFDYTLDVVTEAGVKAPEAVLSVRDGVPMQVNIQTQEIMDMNIKVLGIKEVTTQSMYESGYIPTVGGLFSYVIFGTTAEERKKTWGYIDLHTNLIHPYVYEILTKVQQNIDDICCGKGVWKITENVKKNELSNLVKANPDDPDYNPDNTGIDWFIKNYPKIKFMRNASRERSERLDFLESFAPNEIFIHTWMVMPPFLRDVEMRNDGSPPKIPEINKLYSNVIRFSNSLKQETIGFMNNVAKYNVQKNLVAIRKHFQQLLEKSDGFLHKYVLGKNPDYGARSVISCAVLDQYDKPDDCPIDMTHTGIPLAQICAMEYPFISRWIYNFLQNMFENNKLVYFQHDKKDPGIPGEVSLVRFDDPMSLYTPDYIKKKIDHWINTYESRFEPIEIPLKDGRTVNVQFTGMPYSTDPENINASTISKRPLTWTDLMYMAAVDVSETKTVWITRYPVTSYMGTFPSMIHVLSTIKTMPVIVEGKVYPHYPVINPKLSRDVIARSFNDTVTMSNMYLEGIVGDYDGDTVSMRTPFLEESNEESREIIFSLKQYLDSQGKMKRNITNESSFMLYNLTRDDPKAPKVDDITKGKFMAMNYKDIGVKKIAELFGTNYSKSTKKITGPKYNVCAKMHLDAGEYINKEAVDTTLGRFLFNKILIEPYITSIVPNGYVNDVMVSNTIKSLFSFIGNEVMYGRINTDQLWPFLKAYEFYTTKGVTILAPSYTSNMLVPKADIIEEKNKFFKEHPNATIDEIVEMEDKLVKKATARIENDAGYPLFASDARGSVAGNYKTMSIFTGPVLNSITGEWDRIESDFISGFKKEELPVAGNMLINGQYPKSVGTQDSGYVTKQFNAAYQTVTVDKDGTDCGTKSFIMIRITEKNWKNFEFQNVYDGDKLIVLDETNCNKFFNKIVKMRSPMCCTANVICSVCAGRRPYILGITNIGIQFSDISNDLLNKGMKAFHDSNVSVLEVDPDSLLI